MLQVCLNVVIFLNLDGTNRSEPSTKLLRSAVCAPSTSSAKSKYVLPPVCIICKKEKSFVTETVGRYIY